MNRPIDEFVASFVSMETILTGEVIKTGSGTVIIDVAGQPIEAVGSYEPGNIVICCNRFEQVTITTGPPLKVCIENSVHFCYVIVLRPSINIGALRKLRGKVL
jgi:hypothetical protein